MQIVKHGSNTIEIIEMKEIHGNNKLSVTRSEDNLTHTWIQIFRTVYSIAIQGSEKRASYLKVRSIRGSACTIPEIKSCQTIFTEYQCKLLLLYENKRGFPNLS